MSYAMGLAMTGFGWDYWLFLSGAALTGDMGFSIDRPTYCILHIPLPRSARRWTDSKAIFLDV